MILTQTLASDVPEITKIWEAHHARSFSLPTRDGVIVEANAVEAGKIIAYGQVRHVAEPIFVLDLNATRRQKIKALELLMNEAFRGISKAGLKQIFAFARDPEFADLIVKHFGYQRADLGEFLIREL
jgi:hypothetical protein